MKLDSSSHEDARRLGEALVERATEAAERLKTQARQDAEGLLEKARHVDAISKCANGTLFGTAAGLYAKEFTVETVDKTSQPGWPLDHLDLRFQNNWLVTLASDHRCERLLPPGRYRALLVFTRID